jgi:hypothetical protein
MMLSGSFFVDGVIVMNAIVSTLFALSILAGIAGQLNAADMSGSRSYEQQEREIH